MKLLERFMKKIKGIHLRIHDMHSSSTCTCAFIQYIQLIYMCMICIHPVHVHIHVHVHDIHFSSTCTCICNIYVSKKSPYSNSNYLSSTVKPLLCDNKITVLYGDFLLTYTAYLSIQRGWGKVREAKSHSKLCCWVLKEKRRGTCLLIVSCKCHSCSPWPQINVHNFSLEGPTIFF